MLHASSSWHGPSGQTATALTRSFTGPAGDQRVRGCLGESFGRQGLLQARGTITVREERVAGNLRNGLFNNDPILFGLYGFTNRTQSNNGFFLTLKAGETHQEIIRE